jgi:hypothetical protein
MFSWGLVVGRELFMSRLLVEEQGFVTLVIPNNSSKLNPTPARYPK